MAHTERVSLECVIGSVPFELNFNDVYIYDQLREELTTLSYVGFSYSHLGGLRVHLQLFGLLRSQ